MIILQGFLFTQKAKWSLPHRVPEIGVSAVLEQQVGLHHVVVSNSVKDRVPQLLILSRPVAITPILEQDFQALCMVNIHGLIVDLFVPEQRKIEWLEHELSIHTTEDHIWMHGGVDVSSTIYKDFHDLVKPERHSVHKW